MTEREGKANPSLKVDFSQGPVITISREYGCPGKRIGEQLSNVINEKLQRENKSLRWKWLSKEIIEDSAKELRLSSELTKHLSEYKKHGFFDNLALFFSEDFYPGEAKIKNTIANFVHTAAEEGNVVIVGRAAEAITKNFKQAIHVKLVAPIHWRSEILSHTLGITLAEAEKEALEMDERRMKFREYFEKGEPDIQFYDASFNCKEMTDDEIVELIIILAETRGIL